MEDKQTYDQIISRNEELELQLSEAHEIIDAIRRGEVDAFVVKNEDIHELYTLKSADRSYRVFIEQMSEGALTINKQNIILYANRGFSKQVNSALEKVIGFDLSDFLPALFEKPATDLLATAWNIGHAKGELLLENKNSKKLPVLLSLNRLNTEEGETMSIIVTDLSLQKESIDQKKALDKKDEFISIASHELKTPVTSIKGYVQILQHIFENEGNQNAADMLGKVDTQINKLTNLIGDLLDVKKIENGQLQYNREVFNFDTLVKEVIEETQRILPEHPIRYNIDANAVSKNIFGDRIKVGQVITNLFDNAAKYSSPGSEILVNAEYKDNSIVFSVQDSGIGIPQDQQEKVFERFFRVNDNKENTYAGLGLGLYISAEIIRRHNGNIYLRSEPGNGSVFYFKLPSAS